MIVIPAIDLLDNQAVRLYKGDYSQKTIYSEEPWKLILGFQKVGAELIHLVDLNGARDASNVNETTIRKIRQSASNIKIQLGGGIRNLKRLEFYDLIGINYFIIGTSAILDPQFLEAALAKYGNERIIVGVDAKDGIVRIKGWEEGSGVHYLELLSRLQKLGVKKIIFTDIALDGTLSGPNLNSYKQILNNFDFDLIASGGISSIKDILDLASLEAKKPIYGAITGKAIYEGKLNLGDAIAKVTKG
ncbi:MAG: 1-(5-phosphoribosyl)-5-[(5-phosphoribosylamino)methylideneamino]imidazole-4-carboxamide isomerase [Leptospiraceae bacterium]|nr:1-(5-phosphoribosyl)-5-[(5-phosphoribosylamino)methylideneamino]imidazole-4-carboxamide isomerase [Leptospiraceae bacterium]